MKKHITVEDFNQLSKEHREHLRDITDFKNIVYCMYRNDGNDGYVISLVKSLQWCCEIDFNNKVVSIQENAKGNTRKLYPCYTIGDMMELIYDNCILLEAKIIADGGTFDVKIQYKACKNKFNNLELCDALWECVKWCLKGGLL